MTSASSTTDPATTRTPPQWDPLRTVTSLLAAVPEDIERFERLCGEVRDWEGLFECAGAQGVAGVIQYYLAQPGVGVSPELKKQAGRHLAVQWLSQTRHRAALAEALQALDAAGVRAVLLKGLLLGDRLYPEPSLRPAGDIDLLVSQADLDPAIAALESIGYVAESGLLARYYRENHHHLHLSRPRTPMLELHFRATTGFGVVMPAEEFLSRAGPYRMPEETTAWLLSPEDEFLYLAVHAARHLFESLVWLYDLKLFLRRYPELDWTVVSARARSLGVVAALSLAFEVLDRRLGAAVPHRKDFAPPRRILARLARPVLPVAVRQPKESRREKAGQILYRALLCDHPASSLWFFRHRLLRFARRRAQRYFPKVVPEAWSQ